MFRSVQSISSLLIGMGILLAGSGLLGLLLGLRAKAEGFSDLTVGIVMAGFYAGYIVGAIWCPSLIQRVGHIRAFTAFAAATAAIAIAFGMMVNPGVWFVLRVLNGIGLIGIYMVIESWLNERATENRGQMFSIYMMVNLASVGIGQYLVLIHGIETLASFALVATLFSLGILPIALTPVNQPVPIRTARLPLSRVFSVTPVGSVGSVTSGLISGSFWALGAVYASSLGMSAAQTATFVAVTIAGGAILQWPIGWLSDRHDRRYVMMGAALGSAAALAGIVWMQAEALAWMLPFAFLFGGFSFSLYGLAVAQTHDRFSRDEVLEATKALLIFFGVGAAAGPMVTGAAMSLWSAGFPAMLAGIAIAMTLFTLWRIRVDPPVPVEERGVFAPVELTSTVAMDLDPRTPLPPGEEKEPSDETLAAF